jgi:large subunit ribosomal protein L1
MAGKKYDKALEQYDRKKRYTVVDGVALIPKLRISGKFDETVDVAVRLGVDPKHADQMVRGAVVLPHGTGKSKRVLVLAKADKAKEALEAGADYAGGEEYVNKIKDENWFEFDAVVATPDMMGQVGKIGRLLGPRGLMPNPKVGTVTTDVAKAVSELKSGRIEFRVEKAGIVHAPIGRASFSPAQLADNLNAVLDTLLKLKPSTAKGTYLRSISVSTTHGPGIRIDPVSVASAAQS